MDHEPIKYLDNDVEDGELSEDSDEVYTPLQRPGHSQLNSESSLNVPSSAVAIESKMEKMDETFEQDDSLPEDTSDSDSDSTFNTKNKIAKLRLKPFPMLVKQPEMNAKQKKYNIWSTGLQEECLMENLKGCGVDKTEMSYDRSIESYDYSLKYRLNGDNKLKRRQSTTNSDDSSTTNDHPFKCFSKQSTSASTNIASNTNDAATITTTNTTTATHSKHKRFRANSMGNGYHHQHHHYGSNKKNVRLRLGRKANKSGDDSSSNDASAVSSHLNSPRNILDLNITDGMSSEEIARDLANKLYEEKDDLMLRIVNVLGTSMPLEVFKETQQIERNGGMLICNGARRRTPGGVFLFLLKNSADLAHEDKKIIFMEESKKQSKEQKLMQAMKRDRKVEQLKKSLKIERELTTVLSTRSDELAAITNSKAETHANLSNPPPSPVTDGNRENSSDFDTHEMREVVNNPRCTEIDVAERIKNANVSKPNETLIESFDRLQESRGIAIAAAAAAAAATAAANNLNTYQDDFLDMHCDDMELF